MPVLCKSTTCTYTYVDETTLIQSFSVSDTTITIDGIQLPTEPIDGDELPTDITSVRISNQECVVLSSSDTQIICEVNNPFVTGSWYPEVRTTAGLVAIDSTLLPYEVPLVIDEITPTIFHEEGGEIVTITGSGFPSDLGTNDEVEISFTDGTKCVILTMNFTTITCKVEDFKSKAADTDTTTDTDTDNDTDDDTDSDTADRRNLDTLELTVSMNGNTISSSGIELLPAVLIVTSFDPVSVSPMTPQLITLQLSGSYDSANMEDDTFTVELEPSVVDDSDSNNAQYKRPNGEKTRLLNVVDFDKDANTITVKYGGAYLGTYKINVSSTMAGSFKTFNDF